MSTGNTRLLERLVADGLITVEAQEAALNLVARTGERVEEVILELKALDEAALLKYLAALHKTRFVSTEKLAKADIDRITLDKVPKKLAERDTVFPVLYDAQTATLSVVTPDPDNAPALHDVQLASGVKEVRAFVGRPRAVKAASVKLTTATSTRSRFSIATRTRSSPTCSTSSSATWSATRAWCFRWPRRPRRVSACCRTRTSRRAKPVVAPAAAVSTTSRSKKR